MLYDGISYAVPSGSKAPFNPDGPFSPELFVSKQNRGKSLKRTKMTIIFDRYFSKIDGVIVRGKDSLADLERGILVLHLQFEIVLETNFCTGEHGGNASARIPRCRVQRLPVN